MLKPKTPWRDGATQLVKLPLESIQRLAALVPRPHRPASEQFARRRRERLLSGDQLRAVNVASGRYRELELERSGHPRGRNRFVRVLRLLRLIQPPFGPAEIAWPADCLMLLSANTPAEGNWPQPLQS